MLGPQTALTGPSAINVFSVGFWEPEWKQQIKWGTAQQLNNFKILSCIWEILEFCFAYKCPRDNISLIYCCIRGPNGSKQFILAHSSLSSLPLREGEAVITPMVLFTWELSWTSVIQDGILVSHKPFPVTLHHLVVELKLLYLAARASQAGAKVKTETSSTWDPSLAQCQFCHNLLVKASQDQTRSEGRGNYFHLSMGGGTCMFVIGSFGPSLGTIYPRWTGKNADSFSNNMWHLKQGDFNWSWLHSELSKE